MCFERFCEHHFLGGNTHPHKEYILAKLKDKVSNLWIFFIIKNLLGLTDLLVSIFDILKIS